MTFDVTDAGAAQVLCENCRALCDKRSNFCSRCGQRLQLVEAVPSVKPGKEARSPRSFLQHMWWQRRASMLVAVLLSLVLLNGSFLLVVSRMTGFSHAAQANAIAHTPSGVAWFYDLRGLSDALALHLSALPPLSPGNVYVGWLRNPHRPDQILSTGPLRVQHDGSVTFLSEHEASFNTANLNLRLIFTQVEVTVEASKGLSVRPKGQSVLHGAIAARAVQALLPLFVSTPYTPGQVALLSGLKAQLHELDRWMTNLLDAQKGQDSVGMQADLLRIIYLLEGKNGTDVQHLNILVLNNIQNEGDGFGVLAPTTSCQAKQVPCGYLDALQRTLHGVEAQHLVASVPLAHVQVALTTINTLAAAMLPLALQLVSGTNFNAATPHQTLQILAQLNDALLNGRDLNGDGSIDPVPGEAAAAQLYTYIQSLGDIPLSQ